MSSYLSERLRRTMRQIKSWDGAAMAGSLLCALHCLVQPLLLTSLPFLGWVMGSIAFEIGSLTLTLLISCYALISGFQIHRRLFPMAAALVSASILLSTLMKHSDHSSDSHNNIAIWSACLLLLLTHLVNLRFMESSLRKTWLKPHDLPNQGLP